MINLTCPLSSIAQYILLVICGLHVSKESNLNPKTLMELISGMIVLLIVNGEFGFGKRSHFKEITNKKVLLGENLIC